jgi:hypothetical protein
MKFYSIAEQTVWLDTLGVVLIYDDEGEQIIELQNEGRDLWLQLAKNKPVSRRTIHNQNPDHIAILEKLSDFGLVQTTSV